MIGTMVVNSDPQEAIQSLQNVGVTASVTENSLPNEICVTAVEDGAALSKWLTDNSYDPMDYPAFTGLPGYRS